ncbi:MAG TPA: hypothetical protein V6D30_02990 [Leptolyngbyaceae cyanobacterium]
MSVSVRLSAHAEVRTAEGMHIDWLRFEYLARVLIALATAITAGDWGLG